MRRRWHDLFGHAWRVVSLTWDETKRVCLSERCSCGLTAVTYLPKTVPG